MKVMSIAGFAFATTLFGTGCTEKQEIHRSGSVQKYLASQKNKRQVAAKNLVQGKWQLSIPKSSSMWKTVGKTGFPRYTSPQQLKDHQEFLNDLVAVVGTERSTAQQNLNSTYTANTSDLQLGNSTNQSVHDAQLALLVMHELDNYDLTDTYSWQEAMMSIHSQIILANAMSKVYTYNQAKTYAARTQANREADF